MSAKDEHRYDDIIELPRFISRTRPQMSNHDRAAQFAPFAALTGFGDSILETGRLTDKKPELSDEDREELDLRFQILEDHFKEDPHVKVWFFVRDERKEGGQIREEDITIHQIDTVDRVLISSEKKKYDLDAILNIEGDIIVRYRTSVYS